MATLSSDLKNHRLFHALFGLMLAGSLLGALSCEGIIEPLIFLALFVLAAITWWLVSVRFNQQTQAIQALEDRAVQLTHANHLGILDADELAIRMQNECRRAIREFTPLSVLLVVNLSEENNSQEQLHLAAQIQQLLSRPGDVLGIDRFGCIRALLPSTNEAVKHLGKKLLDAAPEISNLEISVISCTFQPRNDLDVEHIDQMLNELKNQLSDQPFGQLLHKAEAFEDILPSPTY